LTEKTKVPREKPVTVALYPPQIPYGLPGIEPEPPQWEANNLLSHVTALLRELDQNGYYRNRLSACKMGRTNSEIGRMTLDWHAFLAIWMNFQAPFQHKILQTD